MNLTELHILAGIGLGLSLCICIYGYDRMCLGNTENKNRKRKKGSENFIFENDGFEMIDTESTSFVYSENLEDSARTTGAEENLPLRDFIKILEDFATQQEKTNNLEEQIKWHEQKLVRLVKRTKKLAKLIHKREGV